jgi:hypothetical protein
MKVHIEWGPEAPSTLPWQEAIDWCKTMGDGWRLPTIGELRIAYEQNVGGFASSLYWSSSEYNSLVAWYQTFSNGVQDYAFKYYNLRVRACRDVAEAREEATE